MKITKALTCKTVINVYLIEDASVSTLNVFIHLINYFRFNVHIWPKSQCTQYPWSSLMKYNELSNTQKFFLAEVAAGFNFELEKFADADTRQ